MYNALVILIADLGFANCKWEKQNYSQSYPMYDILSNAILKNEVKIYVWVNNEFISEVVLNLIGTCH